MEVKAAVRVRGTEEWRHLAWWDIQPRR